jgi:hypothetical protein
MKLTLCFTIATEAYKVQLNKLPLILDLGAAGRFMSEETATSTQGMRLGGSQRQAGRLFRGSKPLRRYIGFSDFVHRPDFS